MLSKANLKQSIKEIYKIYLKRHVVRAFTLESIQEIFEIGNEVFQKNNPEELEKLKNRPPSKAPDILDDEPFSLERTLEIYQSLTEKYSDVSPELIKKVFEMNSKLAWKAYRKRYDDYILNIYRDYSGDEYINYLAAIVLFDHKEYDEALRCINLSMAGNDSSANYTHIKGLCLMQLGDLDMSRTSLYQALFLVELLEDVPPRKSEDSQLYPNYPIEFHTSADLIRADLKKLDKADDLFRSELAPLVN
jgi:hypothetical protein